MNLKNFCYEDAIFYADKLLHLQQHTTVDFVEAVYTLGNPFSSQFISSLFLFE